MRLDELACYRAISSRDRRFEGHFVVAVTSTGVYCRPGCPAPTPKRENARFYVSPSAAEAAGFRACLRCRPDALPTNGHTLGTGATIRRALRLIEEGALDESSMGELAGRLGVGDRHLRRLFQKHVGAPPLSLARSRRAHFARKLIEETELSLADVALSSGFGSIRSFNAAMRETFRVAPNEFRRRVELAGETTALRLRLPFKPPLNWPATMNFLRPRIVPGVELIEGDRYRRTISVGAWTGSLEVRPAEEEPCLWLELPAAPPAALMPIVARISRMFDLGVDVGPIEQHLAGDDELAPLIRKRPGLRVPGSWDPFELGVRAILGQQVSVAAATTLAARLVESLGTPLQTKRDQSIRLDGTRPPSEVTKALNELPGIGSWTAEYIALRGLHEPDAFPASDLAIRRWLSRERPMGNMEILRRAEAWRPWRAYATIHLWMDGHETEDGRD